MDVPQAPNPPHALPAYTEGPAEVTARQLGTSGHCAARARPAIMPQRAGKASTSANVVAGAVPGLVSARQSDDSRIVAVSVLAAGS